MKEIIQINLGPVQSVDDFHDLATQKLSFPSYYGRNANAFWDCLTDIVDETLVEVIGYNSLNEELKNFIGQYLDMFKEYEEKSKGRFRVIIN